MGLLVHHISVVSYSLSNVLSFTLLSWCLFFSSHLISFFLLVFDWYVLDVGLLGYDFWSDCVLLGMEWMFPYFMTDGYVFDFLLLLSLVSLLFFFFSNSGGGFGARLVYLLRAGVRLN